MVAESKVYRWDEDVLQCGIAAVQSLKAAVGDFKNIGNDSIIFGINPGNRQYIHLLLPA